MAIAARADEAACRADVRAEGVQPSLDLVGQLAPEAEVALDHVAVVELVGGVSTGFGHDLPGARHHPRDQARGDALRAVQELDLGSEGAHGERLLLGERIRRDDPERVALDGTDERERRTGAAAGVLDDGLTRSQST